MLEYLFGQLSDSDHDLNPTPAKSWAKSTCVDPNKSRYCVYEGVYRIGPWRAQGHSACFSAFLLMMFVTGGIKSREPPLTK